MFRICSEFSVMFRICSEFSAIFRICSAMFRICSELSSYTIQVLKNKQYLNKGDHSHSIIHYTSQEILNRPVFVLDILKRVWKFWKDSEHYWKFWTDSEHCWTDSENCWKFWTDSEHYWKFWTDSEHYLSS
jgi:hypothetical protein